MKQTLTRTRAIDTKRLVPISLVTVLLGSILYWTGQARATSVQGPYQLKAASGEKLAADDSPRSRPNIAVGDLNGDGKAQNAPKLLLRPTLKADRGESTTPDKVKTPGGKPQPNATNFSVLLEGGGGEGEAKPSQGKDSRSKLFTNQAQEGKDKVKDLAAPQDGQKGLLLPAVQKVRESAAAQPAKPPDTVTPLPPARTGLLLPAIQKAADPAPLPTPTTSAIAPSKVPTLTVQPATTPSR